jgi:hypothetical protein
MSQQTKNKIIDASAKTMHHNWLELYKNTETQKISKEVTFYLATILTQLFSGYLGNVFNSWAISILIMFGGYYVFDNSTDLYHKYFPLKYCPMRFKKIKDEKLIEFLEKIINTKQTGKDYEYSMLNCYQYESYKRFSKHVSYDQKTYYSGDYNEGICYPIRYNFKEKSFETDIAVNWEYIPDTQTVYFKQNEKINNSNKISNSLIIYSFLTILLIIVNVFMSSWMFKILFSISIALGCIFIKDKFDKENSKFYKSTLLPEWRESNIRAAKECLEAIIEVYPNYTISKKYHILNDIMIKEKVHQQYLERCPWEKNGKLDVSYSDLPREEQEKDDLIIEIVVNNLFKYGSI